MKEKLKVYIDFESITHNFLRRCYLNSKIGFLPYLYTVGLHRNNDLSQKFVHKSSLMTFKNFNFKNYYEKLAENLLNDISIISGEDINRENYLDKIEFYGWNPGMENTVLNRILNVGCKNIIHDHEFKTSISLKLVIPNDESVYFEETAKIDALNKPDSPFMKHDDPGFRSSFLGYQRFINFNNINTYDRIILSNEDLIIIDKELINYNKDDVLKLDFCVRNKQLIKQRARKLAKYNEEIAKKSKKLYLAETNLSNLEYIIGLERNEHKRVNDLVSLEEYIAEKHSLYNRALKYVRAAENNLMTVDEFLHSEKELIKELEKQIQQIRENKNQI
ncbi:hypothetical protein H9M94_02775 [Mycoplasma sp. Pen4]|uniref:hypothetical protein n=1 Tax=Mycoplasma sp. Pen4 TaxID=640330 RepID=UPI00165441C1|nr:hypothetical protein [Mycoplasma sp. Pen4]QNM93510.1 hypothetical protein H9M94_02775 [Mycoplasma sp. Pen4]